MKVTCRAMLINALLISCCGLGIQSATNATEPVIEENGPITVFKVRGNFLTGTFKPTTSGAARLWFIGDPKGVLKIRVEATGETKTFNLGDVEFGQRLDVLETAPLSLSDQFPVTLEVSGKVEGLFVSDDFVHGSGPQFEGAGNASATYFSSRAD